MCQWQAVKQALQLPLRPVPMGSIDQLVRYVTSVSAALSRQLPAVYSSSFFGPFLTGAKSSGTTTSDLGSSM